MSDGRPPSEALIPDITYTELVHIVVGARRRIALLSMLCVLLAVVWTVSTPRRFTAQAQLTPVGGAQPAAGRLTALAAQFGVGGVLSGAGDSPDFLVDVITSREMLMSLIDRSYSIAVPSRLPFGLGGEQRIEGSVVELLDLDTDPSVLAKSREKALEALRDDIVARSRLESGVVTVSVTSISPDLSAALLRDLLAQLETFNIDRRQSQAGAEREFVDARLTLAKQEVAQAERSLGVFLERNRSFEGSPTLRFEYESLSREVSLRHDILRTLSQASEHARIEEVRATPVYTVVSAPYKPALPNSRNGFAKVLAGLVLGILIGAGGALFASLLSKEKAELAELGHSRPSIKELLAADFAAAREILRRS